MPEGTSDIGDIDALVLKRVTINELHRHNHTLEDDVQNIRQNQQDLKRNEGN